VIVHVGWVDAWLGEVAAWLDFGVWGSNGVGRGDLGQAAGWVEARGQGYGGQGGVLLDGGVGGGLVGSNRSASSCCMCGWGLGVVDDADVAGAEL
jgi:hypothetical protein